MQRNITMKKSKFMSRWNSDSSSDGKASDQSKVSIVKAPQLNVQMSGTNLQPNVVKYPVITPSRLGQASSVTGAGTSKRFTGTVTKLHENCGFIDNDVIFQKHCVEGTCPRVGDRVTVEATFNPNLPYKWNATRVQTMASDTQGFGTNQDLGMSQIGAQNFAVPPPIQNQQSFQDQQRPQQGLNQVAAAAAAAMAVALQSVGGQQNNPMIQSMISSQQFQQNLQQSMQQSFQQHFPTQQQSSNQLLRSSEDDVRGIIRSVADRRGVRGEARRGGERRRDSEGRRDRGGFPRFGPRKRSRSPDFKPTRRRSRSGSKNSHSGSVSKSPVRESSANHRQTEVRRRYNVQIPRIQLDLKDMTVLHLNTRYSSMYVPSDFFTASVGWGEVFPPHRSLQLGRSCGFHIMNKNATRPSSTPEYSVPSDSDRRYSAKVMLLSTPVLDDLYHGCCMLAEDPVKVKDASVHPSRLIKFLVGLVGKKEPMALGGPWSPSLDGEDPEGDPRVLIRTAVRTVKQLTSIDLSRCTQWYRFAEIRYMRGEEKRKGVVIPPHVETVVLFLPDVWSCLPAGLQWHNITSHYSNAMNVELRNLFSDSESSTDSSQVSAVASEESLKVDSKDEEEGGTDDDDGLATHHSKLDVKSLNMKQLRRELECRSSPSKGLKAQLVARLNKLLKEEQEEEEKISASKDESGTGDQTAPPVNATVTTAQSEQEAPKEEEKSDTKQIEEEEKRKRDLEKKKEEIKQMYHLPESPVIVVHPSKEAKSGKFDCGLVSLSVLLDYRQDDNKEHCFEVSLFSELFNEMLMRDFGLCIYKNLCEAEIRKKTEKKETEVKTESSESSSNVSAEDSKKESDEKSPSVEKSETNGDPVNKKPKLSADDKDKEEEQKKKVTVNRELLLSFSYFDQSHAGYMRRRDMEDLLHISGLRLSRAQIKSLLGGVDCKDTLDYRKMTDKEEQKANSTDLISTTNHSSVKTPSLTFELGNLGELKKSSVLDEGAGTEKGGVVMYRGAAVDLENVLQKINEYEKQAAESDVKLRDTLQELSALKKRVEGSDGVERSLKDQMSEREKSLEEERSTTKQLQTDIQRYRTTLTESAASLIWLQESIKKALADTPPTSTS